MAGRKSDFTLTKLDDLFSTQEQRDEEMTAASRPIRTAKSLSRDFVSEITPFPRFRIVSLLPMCFLRIRLQPSRSALPLL